MDAQIVTDMINDMESKLSVDYVKEIRNLPADQLQQRVIQYSQEIEQIEYNKSTDGKLKTLKSQVSDLNAGYRDLKKEVEKKRKYILLTLQDRGLVD